MLKILIVDDEPPIREWIVSLANSLSDRCIVVGSVSNGENAITLFLKYHPDVVLTDVKMPTMDGIDLLAKMNTYGYHFYGVVLSNYSDFNYARRSFAQGAFEYILKSEISIERLQAVFDSIEKDKLLVKPMIPYLSFLDYYHSVAEIADPDTNDIYFDMVQKFHLPIKSDYIASITLQLDAIPMQLWLDQITYEIIPPELENLCYFYKEPSRMIMLFNLSKGVPASTHQYCLRKFAQKLQMIFHCSIGVSLPVYHLNQIIACIEQSLQSLNMQFYLPQCEAGIFFYADFPPSAKLDWLQNGVEDIIKLVMEKDIVKAQESLTVLFEEVDRIHPPVAGIKAFSISIVSLLAVNKPRQDPRLIIEEMNHTKTSIELTHDFSALKDVVNASFNAYLQEQCEQQKKYSQCTHTILTYIEEHYQEPIGMKDLAAIVNYHPDYLYRLFQKETGITFNTYLTNFRLQKAAQLLQATNYSVNEISLLVGYTSFSHFSKIFKSLYGESPFHFRNKYYKITIPNHSGFSMSD